MHRYRLHYPTTLTYSVIEHAQWKQHMALVGAVGENTQFVGLSKGFEANRTVFYDFRLFGGIKHCLFFEIFVLMMTMTTMTELITLPLVHAHGV